MSSKKKELLVNCFKCQKKVIVKYNNGTNKYSQINNWGYWTEQEGNKEKYICNPCLLNLYENHKEEYLATITNKKRRNLIRSYVYSKRFS